MKVVVHFLCKSVNGQLGGMEESIGRIAGYFGRRPDTTVRIYSLNDDEACRLQLAPNVQLVLLRQWKELLTEPLASAENSTNHAAEVQRATFLAYTCAVRSAMNSARSARHILVSFYISQTGFVAQQVADELEIPHIASIRGSDFNRDLREPAKLGAIAYVLRRSQFVVTINRTHADLIRKVFARRSNVTTIPNSIPFSRDTPFWEQPGHAEVRLFADCGFSYKKGTHLLLRAVADLRREDRPVKLTITGNVDAEAATYWLAQKRSYARAFPMTFLFRDRLDSQQMLPLMLQSDIYCSATLGEGCSLARLKALALGMPVVTTRCGEMLDLALGAGHVHLCEPGGAEEYKTTLRSAVDRALRGEILVRRRLVAGWRKKFRPEIECAAWQKVLQRTLSDG